MMCSCSAAKRLYLATASSRPFRIHTLFPDLRRYVRHPHPTAGERKRVVHQNGIASLGQFVGPRHAAVVILLMRQLDIPRLLIDPLLPRQPKNFLPPWSCNARIPGRRPCAFSGLRKTASVGGPHGSRHPSRSTCRPSYSPCHSTRGVGTPPRSTGARHSHTRFLAAVRHSFTFGQFPVRNDMRPGPAEHVIRQPRSVNPDHVGAHLLGGLGLGRLSLVGFAPAAQQLRIPSIGRANGRERDMAFPRE